MTQHTVKKDNCKHIYPCQYCIIKCWNCGTPRKIDDMLYAEQCPVCQDEEYDTDNYDRQEEDWLSQYENEFEFEI